MKNAKTFFKKALSLFVATLILLSMCSLSFGVFAEEADYVVEYNNPALPMYAQSKIDLSKVSVEITEGNVVDGSKINWSTDDSSVVLDNSAKTLTIYAEGAYEIYASYGGVAKTVVAVVIPADAVGDENGDYEAEIFEYDFTNGTWDDFKKDWSLQFKYSNVTSFSAPAAPLTSTKSYSTKGFVPFVASYKDENGNTVRNNLYFNGGTLSLGFMYLKSGNIVENFANYNVYATGYLGQLSFNTATSSSGSAISRAGIIGRAILNKDGVIDYKSNYQVALASIANNSSYKVNDAYAHLNAYMTRQACMVWGYNSETSSYFGENVNGIATGNLYTIYARYNENEITTGLTKGDYETATAFAERTVNSECTQYYDTAKKTYVAGEVGLGVEEAGTVGFLFNGAETQLQKFRVTYNVDLNNMPATIVTETVNYFTVDSELPYFVMYENTTVDLSKFIVNVGGSNYFGNQVEWSTEDTDITLDTENYHLTSGNYGDATFTVTVDGISTEIYLYVIKESDTEVNIIDYDFTVGSWEDWSKDWGIQVANRSGANSTLNITWFDPMDTLPTSTYDYAAKGIKGIVPFITRYKDENGTNVNVNTYDSHKALGIMYSKNPLIAKMSDYKLTAKSYIYERGFSSTTSTSRSSSAGASGLIGRIELNNGVVTTASRYQGYAIKWKSGNNTNFTATLDKGTPAASSDLVKEVGFGVLAISKGIYGHINTNPGAFAAPDGVGGGITDTEMHEQYVTYQSVYSGGSVTVGFGLDDTVDADTATITNTAYRVGSNGYQIYKHNTANDLGATNAGTVGYMFFGIEEAVQNFKATIALDTARIPETVEIVIPEIEYTEVGATTELRMLPGTNADLALLELTIGDEKVGGDAIAWTCANSDATIEDGVFTAQKAGAYRITATYGEQTKDINIYVVAADATEAVIADFDFTDEETKANWNKYFGLNFSTNGKANLVNQTTLPTVSYTSAKGIVPFTYKIDGTSYGSQGNTDTKGVYGVFYLKDDFVAGLSDYTVTANFKMFGTNYKAPYSNGGSSASHMSGFGLATQIVVGEDGIVDDYFRMNVNGNYVNSAVATFLNNIQLETSWIYAKWSAFTSLQAVCNNSSVAVTFAGSETLEIDNTSTTTGTVGMIYKGCDFDLHSFKVTHSLENAIYAPVKVIEEKPDEVEITENINLGVNEVYNLTNATVVFKGNAIAGSEVKWSVADSNAYELNGTKLYTFAETDFNLLATYKGVEKKITVSIKNDYNGTNEKATALLATLDNGSLAVTKYGYGKYLIAVNSNEGYTLKAGSLKVNVGGKTINVTSKTNTAGTVFGFAAESIDGAVIGAEFVEQNAADISMLGGTIRLATETLTSGIRFGGRVNNIKSAKLTDTIIVDGKEYKTLGVGTLMLPSPLLEGELTVDTENVANKAIKMVVDATENYADVAVTLTGIPKGKMRDIKISARTYIMYEDENGDAQYYYSDVVERSYNEVYGIVYPTVENDGAINEIVTVESTKTSGLNKEFAFNIKINGRYTVNYVLNDKDGNQVAGGVISSLDAYNQYVKVGALGSKVGTYQLTVTAKDVDLVGRKNSVDLIGTYTIQVYDEEILISDTQKYLNTQSYQYGNKKGADTTYLKFTVMTDQHYAWSNYGDGNNSYMNTRRNFAEALNRSESEFVFMAGDNVDWALNYKSNIETNDNLYVLQEALAPLTTKDVYAIFGNHDNHTGDFTNNLVVDAGNITIIGYTTSYFALPTTSGNARSTGLISDDTINWVKEQCEAALERNPDTHLVLINHYALQYNTSKFTWPTLYDGDADLAAKKAETLNRNKILDVITQYGVELYINGHEHNNNMNFEEITYENGLGTGCINYNCGNSPTDITIEEYVDKNGETKLRVTADQYVYGSFSAKVDDISTVINRTVEFDLIENGLTAEETLANAKAFYVADAALRAEYSGKYNELYSYSFEYAGVEIVDGVKCYKFNVSRYLYYISDSTVYYDESVTEKKGILRETLKTIYISGGGTIVR